MMFSFVWKMILTNEKYFPLGLSISIKPNQKYINIAISWTRRRQFPCMCINCPSISVNTVNCKLYCPPQIFKFTVEFGYQGRKEAIVYNDDIPYVNMKNWCHIKHRLHVWCHFFCISGHWHVHVLLHIFRVSESDRIRFRQRDDGRHQVNKHLIRIS